MQGPVDYPVPPPVEGVGGGGTGYGWSEIGTRSLNTTAGVIDVNKHPTSDLLHVWSMPSTATIGHQEHPRPLEQVRLILEHLKGEASDHGSHNSRVDQGFTYFSLFRDLLGMINISFTKISLHLIMAYAS